jgi:excisionase family DNA binding protein
MATTNTTANERAFLSLDDAAEELGCTRRFLERRIEDGELSVFRPSARLVRIQRRELNRWIEVFTVRPAGPERDRGYAAAVAAHAAKSGTGGPH